MALTKLDDGDSALVMTELRFDGSNISGLPEKARFIRSNCGWPWSCLL